MKRIKGILLIALAGMALMTGCKGASIKTTETETETETTTEKKTEKTTEKDKTTATKTDAKVGLGTVTTAGTQATTEAASSGSSTQSNTTSGTATDNTTYTQNTVETTQADTTSQTTTDSAQTAQSATDAEGDLICPYCGLVYSGSDMTNYYSHIAACAEAEGAKSSLATCPYCGEEFSTVIDDPASPGESMYDSHLAFEEWANREYVMCQLCGEYYKNGTTHVCGQQ